MRLYILDALNRPVRVHDMSAWASWLEHHDCRIAFDTVDGVRVSTVFLALLTDREAEEELLFETMILDGPRSGDAVRHATWDEAEQSHRRAMIQEAQRTAA